MGSYSRFCYRWFGEYVRPIRSYFADLHQDLVLAGLNFTLDEYLSMALFTSLLTFMCENITLAFIFGLFFDLPIALTLSFLLAIALSTLILFLFYSYPATLARKKARDMDRVLPFATTYMACVAAGKTEPYYLFSTVGSFEEYGEVAKRFNNIARNIKFFGMNAVDAIKREALRVPSKSFRELLWGIVATLMSGGDLRGYLKERSELYMAEHRRSIQKYSQDLSLFTEIYLTLVITGSIFFVVLTSIMAGTAGLEIVMLQSMIVFVFLPLISIAFIVLMKLRSPVK
ncbi:MAG: hypothetical protein DRN49_05645 [Thaumarchaeota archaeon]|nr:MAG: hypothetical protein DRN49_05645 [Nitrososphaerota archaeon]